MSYRKTLEEKKIAKISYETGVPEAIIEASISVLFKYMKAKIEEPKLIGQDILSSEDFTNNVPIVKIPGLGFMVPSYKRYLYLKKNELKKLMQN